VERLDLAVPERTEAALPALLLCPQAAQLALGSEFGLALTDEVLTFALTGRFQKVDDILLDRLDRTSVDGLRRFVSLASRPELKEAASPLLASLRISALARARVLGGELESVSGEPAVPLPPAPEPRTREPIVRMLEPDSLGAASGSGGNDVNNAEEVKEESAEPMPAEPNVSQNGP
jgi:hypothetical protein